MNGDMYTYSFGEDERFVDDMQILAQVSQGSWLAQTHQVQSFSNLLI